MVIKLFTNYVQIQKKNRVKYVCDVDFKNHLCIKKDFVEFIGSQPSLFEMC